MKTHLLVRVQTADGYTWQAACGQFWRRSTHSPAEVTCGRCRRTVQYLWARF